jgi:hypothetical protein
MESCPICNSPCETGGTDETSQVTCLRCGTFAIQELTSIVLKQTPLTSIVRVRHGWGCADDRSR